MFKKINILTLAILAWSFAGSAVAQVSGVYGTAGTLASAGAIIIDNTANPGKPGVVTNMATQVGGKAFNVNNSFNIDAIQVMQRDISVTPHRLDNDP